MKVREMTWAGNNGQKGNHPRRSNKGNGGKLIRRHARPEDEWLEKKKKKRLEYDSTGKVVLEER